MAAWVSACARRASRWLGEALVLLLPSRCFSCESLLPRLQLMGACTTCWASLAGSTRRRCRRCALPLPDRTAERSSAPGICAKCAVAPLPFARVVAALDYDARARRFLLRAKDGHRPEILTALAGQLGAAVSVSAIAAGLDGIVPVPSTRLARWRRGFDPARLLAQELSRRTGVPLFDRVIRRRGLGGPAAKKLGARARWRRAVCSVEACRTIAGTRVLLVDDVLTTGATATACAAALRSAGALEVRLAVWARTLPSTGDFDLPREGRL